MASARKPGNYTPTPDAAAPLALTVPAALAGLRLDQALARLLPDYSRSRLQAWIRAAHITVAGAPARARDKLRGGERVEIRPAALPAQTAHAPEPLPLDIVFEDEALIVLNKPAGLVVHPGAGNWQGTLLNALLHHHPALAAIPRAGIVHRLDKDTSGLMVVAKTLPAQAALVRQLQARSVTREYLALVHGRVAARGKVDAPLGRHPTARTRMAVTQRGRQAVTHYAPLRRLPGCTLLACRLETGRTHQIRVHLREIGHPLVGDPVYGRKAAAGRGSPLAAFPRQALHAARLALLHPVTGQSVAWEAPLPADFATLLAELEAR